MNEPEKWGFLRDILPGTVGKTSFLNAAARIAA
jgi:hypothetical protein